MKKILVIFFLVTPLLLSNCKNNVEYIDLPGIYVLSSGSNSDSLIIYPDWTYYHSEIFNSVFQNQTGVWRVVGLDDRIEFINYGFSEIKQGFDAKPYKNSFTGQIYIPLGGSDFKYKKVDE